MRNNPTIDLPVHRAVVRPRGEGGGSLSSTATLRQLASTVSEVLRTAVHDAPATELRHARLPCALEVGEYCAYRMSILAEHAQLPIGRIRPSVSTDIEPSKLVHTFVRETGWKGAIYMSCSNGDDDGALRVWAQGQVSARRAPAVVLGSVSVDRDLCFEVQAGVLVRAEPWS